MEKSCDEWMAESNKKKGISEEDAHNVELKPWFNELEELAAQEDYGRYTQGDKIIPYVDTFSDDVITKFVKEYVNQAHPHLLDKKNAAKNELKVIDDYKNQTLSTFDQMEKINKMVRSLYDNVPVAYKDDLMIMFEKFAKDGQVDSKSIQGFLRQNEERLPNKFKKKMTQFDENFGKFNLKESLENLKNSAYAQYGYEILEENSGKVFDPKQSIDNSLKLKFNLRNLSSEKDKQNKIIEVEETHINEVLMGVGYSDYAYAERKAIHDYYKHSRNHNVEKRASSNGHRAFFKKIPYVSLVAGAVYGCERIFGYKDIKGGMAEFASGIAGNFFGVGTAISAAIDAGIHYRDDKDFERITNEAIEKEKKKDYISDEQKQINIERFQKYQKQAHQHLVSIPILGWAVKYGDKVKNFVMSKLKPMQKDMEQKGASVDDRSKLKVNLKADETKHKVSKKDQNHTEEVTKFDEKVDHKAKKMPARKATKVQSKARSDER